MTIKSAFIAAISVFLLFILFKGSIQHDQGQLLFALAFVLLEILIIAAVVIKRRKRP